MSSYQNVNSDVVTADRILSSEPCLLWGAVILCSASGGDATIYDGRDSSSGEAILPLKGLANLSLPIFPAKPIYCSQGLYVDIGSSVTSVTVIWESIE